MTDSSMDAYKGLGPATKSDYTLERAAITDLLTFSDSSPANLERGFYTTQTVSFGEPVVKSKSALRSVVYGAHTDGS